VVDEEAVAAADETSLRSLGGKEFFLTTDISHTESTESTEINSKEFRRKGVFNHGLNGLDGYEADRNIF
jgi:hypothetical protein